MADDHRIVWEGLIALLGAPQDVEVVAEASDGQTTVGRHLNNSVGQQETYCNDGVRLQEITQALV